MPDRIIRIEMYARIVIPESDIEQAVSDGTYDGEKIENEKDAIFWITAEKVRNMQFDVRDWTHYHA